MNEGKSIEWMLSYWMTIELLNTYQVSEWTLNYWKNIKFLKKHKTIE